MPTLTAVPISVFSFTLVPYKPLRFFPCRCMYEVVNLEEGNMSCAYA